MPDESRIDGVIFDLDGTLIDTLHDIMTAMNAVLAARALPTHGAADYKRFIGNGVVHLAELALPEQSRDLTPSVVAEFRAHYHAHLLDQSAPYPGIEALLEELGARSVPMCVLSNKPDAPTRHIIGALLGDVPFMEVVGERPERARKPDPGVALELAARMGVSARRCALVGDTRIDMRTARNTGMLGVGVAWGFEGETALRDEGAAVVLQRPQELLLEL
jgi:phosphoglycolate phosphatase